MSHGRNATVLADRQLAIAMRATCETEGGQRETPAHRPLRESDQRWQDARLSGRGTPPWTFSSLRFQASSGVTAEVIPLTARDYEPSWCSCSAPPPPVPSGPAGAGIVNLPGTFVPGTPFTDSVEYAYVSAANATASELTARACRLLLANVAGEVVVRSGSGPLRACPVGLPTRPFELRAQLISLLEGPLEHRDALAQRVELGARLGLCFGLPGRRRFELSAKLLDRRVLGLDQLPSLAGLGTELLRSVAHPTTKARSPRVGLGKLDDDVRAELALRNVERDGRVLPRECRPQRRPSSGGPATLSGTAGKRCTRSSPTMTSTGDPPTRRAAR